MSRSPRTSPALVRTVQRRKRAAATVGIAVSLALLLTGVGRKLYQRHRIVQEQREALIPGVYWVIGPFGPELQRPYEPELHPDPTRPCKGPNGETLRWKELPVTEGVQYLDFRNVFRKDSCSGYALTYIVAPEDQSGVLLLGSDDTIKVWVNGEPVHEYTRLRSAHPDDDRVAVQWRQGRNVVLVKVVNATGDHQFFLKCAGAAGLTATTNPQE